MWRRFPCLAFGITLGALFVGLGPAVAWAARPAARPTSRPSTRPAEAAPDAAPSTQPAVKAALDGAVEYVPPAGWKAAPGSSRPNRGAFVSPHGDGMIAIDLLPPASDVFPNMGGAVVKQLREWRKSKGQKIVLDPRVERDPRFALRVHEQYATDEKGERVADQLHLYRRVGPRVVMVTVNAVTPDPERAKAIQATGEETALSATLIPPAKPDRPAAPNRGGRVR